MKTRTILRILSGLACWFCGCDRPATPVATRPPQADLRFPVIVVWTGESLFVETPDEGLKKMNFNYVTGTRAQPVVIDSDLKIYDMNGLQTTMSGIGLMINGGGTVPIKFELAPHGKQGLAAARQLIIDCKWLGAGSDDSDKKRIAIADATTLEEMIAILQGEPN